MNHDEVQFPEFSSCNEGLQTRLAESGLADKLGPAIMFLGRLVARRLEQALASAGLGLKPAQARILVTLYLHGPMNQQAIAAHTDVEPSTLVSTLDVMERGDLARRDPNPDDRRSHVVQLTQAGEEMLPKLFSLWEDIERDLAAALSESEREALHDQLRRLIHQFSSKESPCG